LTPNILLDSKDLPLAVIEAKKTSKDARLGQRQAEGYVEDLYFKHGTKEGYAFWNQTILNGYLTLKPITKYIHTVYCLTCS
jgi:type I site-specific restriction endonuclease